MQAMDFTKEGYVPEDRQHTMRVHRSAEGGGGSGSARWRRRLRRSGERRRHSGVRRQLGGELIDRPPGRHREPEPERYGAKPPAIDINQGIVLVR